MTLLYITHPALEICFQSFNFLCQSFIFCFGPFNNYVDKMRGGRGSKNSCCCPRSGYKNCPRRRGVGGGMSKNGKILSTQLLNDPFPGHIGPVLLLPLVIPNHQILGFCHYHLLNFPANMYTKIIYFTSVFYTESMKQLKN